MAHTVEIPWPGNFEFQGILKCLAGLTPCFEDSGGAARDRGEGHVLLWQNHQPHHGQEEEMGPQTPL